MPRKKGVTDETRPLIVRIAVRLDDDLRLAAQGLGVDVSNLVRMVLIEHVPTYIERGLDARRRAESARGKVEKGNEDSDNQTHRKSKTGRSARLGGPDEHVRNVDI